MKLIKITSLVKRRTKNMIADLMPEYKYIRIFNSGLVVLKSKWYSLKREVINITDLYIDIFPRKISNACRRKGYGDTYAKIFSNDIYLMLQLRSYKKDMDIVDYIWSKFNALYREVPTIIVNESVVLTLESSSRYTPVLSPVSCKFIPGIEKLLRRDMKTSVESLIEKISKIKLRRPLFLVRSVDLQLAA